MDTVDKLNAIFNEHKANFSGGFHNCLWQIMVNESLANSDAQYAFTPLHDNRIVIAASDGGYLRGCHCFLADTVTYSQAGEIADSLNASVFGLLPDGAMRVIGKSMSKQKRA
jgi:hypothetical protein